MDRTSEQCRAAEVRDSVKKVCLGVPLVSETRRDRGPHPAIGDGLSGSDRPALSGLQRVGVEAGNAEDQGEPTSSREPLPLLAEGTTECLRAIEYERNYAPIKWFRAHLLPTPRPVDSIRRMREVKEWQLKLTSKGKCFQPARRKLTAEIRELDKQLVEGKQ